MRTDIKCMWAGVAAWAVFSLLLAARTLGPEPATCETYREMRQIYEESQGAYGWPEGAIKGCEK